jgi:hypothetical protein
MTYQQYSDHIKVCQYLGKEPQGEFKAFYDFITGLWKDMEFSVNDNHNKQGIVIHKGSDYYMEQDFKNGYSWCHPERVWSFFQSTKGMEYTETQVFIQSMVEEHLKCQVLTLESSRWQWVLTGGRTPQMQGTNTSNIPEPLTTLGGRTPQTHKPNDTLNR